MAGPTFTAHYRGGCGDCEVEIQPGDEVTYVLGDGPRRLTHVICPEQIVERRGDICGRCFLELPLTGECPSC